MDTILIEILNITQCYTKINQNWNEEVLNEGMTFNYESQKLYKAFIELDAPSFKFSQIAIAYETGKARENLLYDIINLIKENIRLYEENKNFFSELNRTNLRIDHFRKVMDSNEDNGRISYLLQETDNSIETEDYYTSPIFNDILFLNIDYHYYIYINSVGFLKNIKNDFKKLFKFQNYAIKENREFFNLKLVGEIYNLCNGIVFESVSQSDFFNKINLLRSSRKFEIKEDKTLMTYYLIMKLSESLSGDNCELWTKSFLNQHYLNYITYNKKKNTIKPEKPQTDQPNKNIDSLATKIEKGILKYKSL